LFLAREPLGVERFVDLIAGRARAAHRQRHDMAGS
jgi:hypothetical protein